jgi:hypothetical protein
VLRIAEVTALLRTMTLAKPKHNNSQRGNPHQRLTVDVAESGNVIK